jgi:uncharacterized membrane protein YesL
VRLRISHDTLSTVLGAVHLGLLTNLLLVLATAPFTVLLLGTDLARSWPLLVLIAPTSVPALVAAGAVFADQGADGVWRGFWRAWRRALRRGLLLGVLVTGALALVVLDVRFLMGRTAGAVLIPVLAVLGLLVAATAVHAVVALAEVPDAGLRTLLTWSGYLAVRRWYLTAVSLTVLGLLALFVLSRPALGLGVAAAPLLYAVWANCRYALRPALDRGGPAVAERPPTGAAVTA